MKIIQYAQNHPIATGAVVIIGGIIFILIVRGGGGGSSQAVASGPSDAEIAANAQIQAAQIAAAANTGAASIGAGVQLNSDNKAAEVAMRQIEASQEVQDRSIDASATVYTQEIAATQSRSQSILNVINTLGKKRKNRALQSFITGQVVQKQKTPGNSAGDILNGVSGLVSSVGSVIPGF